MMAVFSFLRRFVGRTGARGLPPKGGRAFVEPLEERRLLSATLTALASFSENDYLGCSPVVDSAGDVYGADNAVFEIPAGTHDVRALTTFPAAELAIDAAGNVYGVDSNDNLFELSAGGHALTRFPGPGAEVADLIADGAGDLFGLAVNADNVTVLFGVRAGTHSVSTPATVSDGALYATENLTRDSAGDLFWIGGGTSGTPLFELAAGSHAVTTAYSFPGLADFPTIRRFHGGRSMDHAGEIGVYVLSEYSRQPRSEK